MQADNLTASHYCKECLHGRGELIHYASAQRHCAVCRSELSPLDFAQKEKAIPSADQVLADPATSYWLCRALREALARDPVDVANDAEVLARVLEARCREILVSQTH